MVVRLPSMMMMEEEEEEVMIEVEVVVKAMVKMIHYVLFVSIKKKKLFGKR
jgi:hypothetical protein